MHSFVINLDRRYDRFESFKKRCPIQNVQRFSAIDGQKIGSYNEPIIKEYVAKNKSVEPGVLGCSLSHFLLWDQIKNYKETDLIIIMEDDVDFSEDFSSVIIPGNLELLYLGGRGIWGKNFTPKPEELQIGWQKIDFNCSKNRNLYLRKQSQLRGHCVDRCTEGYIISAATAKKLVNLLRNKLLDQPIDGLINHCFYDKYINVLEIFPHPCFVINNDSDIKKIYKPELKVSFHINDQHFSTVRKIKIGFVDFWSNFNINYNFFTLMLSNLSKNITIEIDHTNPDLLFYSVFGQQHKKFTCRKIFFTGENIRPKLDEYYSLGFDYINSDNYSRLPLWYLFLDLFNCDLNKIGDPYPIPLQIASTEVRDRFCAFITSGTSFFRDTFFKELSKYKNVDSAGKNLNNTKELISISDRHDINWVSEKIKFLQKYKFCIAFENSSHPGYVTEKLIHAKLAGCIPIYWGDSTIDKQFNTQSFINVHSYKTIIDVIEEIKRLDNDNTAYLAMSSQSLFIKNIDLQSIVNNILK